MTTRRDFLGASIAAGLSFSFPKGLRSLYTSTSSAAIWAPLLQPGKDETLITVLHTNDTHSQSIRFWRTTKLTPEKAAWRGAQLWSNGCARKIRTRF